MIKPCTLLAPLLATVCAVGAQPDPAASSKPAAQQLDKVEVTGQSNDDSKRRAATASKIIISRDELLRFGDSNLVDLMRRLPGVTPTGRPGRGGGVSMRGMGGGFTQILVDGERMAPGFSLDQIPPDQIERIEIQRAPTAETGARAVAGSINIVLREPLARKLNEFRVQLGGDHGEPQFNAAWTRNDSFSPDLNYSLTMAANSRRSADETFSRTERRLNDTLIESRSSESHSLNERLGLNLNGRLQWKLGEGDSLMLMPFVALGDGENRSFTLQTGEPRYTRVDNEGEGRQRMLRLNGQYQSRLAPYTRLDLRFGGGRGQFDSESKRQQSGGTENRVEEVASTSRNDNLTANAKLSHQTAAEHNWVSGFEFERGKSDSERIQFTNGQLEVGTGEFGESLSASTRRFAAYTQDEWQATPNWSLHGGLRYEQIESKGNRADGTSGPVSNTSKVWSPLLHALWKPDPKSRDQVRMSLTRSYRPASLNDLLARRVTNSQAPTGPNTEDRADRAGNAELDPELATGLELAYERYLPKGGMLSANLFYRDIKGLIRTVLAQETVLLDGVPTLRWTQRPQNLGNAKTWGVEFEVRGRIDDLVGEVPDGLLPLQLRANLALFDSKVEDIRGPNNRIDAQPRGTFNLGADYRFPDSAWAIGANWSYTPDTVIQQTEILQVRSSKRVVVDAYAQYTQSSSLSWRLGLSNLSARDALGESLISTSSGLTSRTETLNPTYLSWSLRAEMRF
jgi:outer membrane receptor for ferrienterochelin and colicins